MRLLARKLIGSFSFDAICMRKRCRSMVESYALFGIIHPRKLHDGNAELVLSGWHYGAVGMTPIQGMHSLGSMRSYEKVKW